MRKLQGIAAMVAIGALTACAPGVGAKVVKLRIMHWGSNVGIEEAVKRWDAQNPDIQVVFDGSTGWGDYFSKLPVMVAAGSPPDLFSQLPELGRFEELAARGVMKDLTPYFKADGILNDMYPQAVETATIGGKIYGAPFGISNNGFLGYNIDLFNQAGVTLPTHAWTTNDFVEAAVKLTKDTNGDGKPEQFGSTPINFARGVILSAGGEIYNKAGTALGLNTKDSIRAMQWIQDLWLKYRVLGGAFPAKSTKAAMDPGHPQQIILDVSSAKNIRAGITWFPKDAVTGTRQWELDQNMVCMAANTKHPNEAWKFLRWFISKDGLLPASRDTFGTTQLLPSLKSAALSAAYMQPNRAKLPAEFNMEEIATGIEQFSVSHAPPRLGYELRAMLETNFTPVTKGQISVQQFVDKSVHDATSIFVRSAKKK